MSGRKSDPSRLVHRVSLWLLLVISFVASVVVRWLGGALAEAISAALDALFIAAFLALTVDPFLKREFFQEASADIFFFWLGYALPHEVNDYLQSFVMDTKLLRRDCVLTWTLNELEADKVRLELDVAFDFQNVTNQVQHYQQGGRLFGSASQERVIEMRCVAPGFSELEYVWGPRDFQASADGWLLGPDCKIPPQVKLDRMDTGVPDGNMITFGIRYSSIHDAVGTDTWKTAAPTLNLHVICRPADKFEFTVDLDKAQPAGPGSWLWEGILLKNHSISVSWRRI